MQRNKFHSVLCVWLASTVAAGGCRPPVQVTTPRSTPGSNAPDPNAPAALAAASSSTGRPQIPVSQAKQGELSVRFPDPKVAMGTAVVTPLSTGETQALIKRLEPLPDLSAQNAAAPSLRAPSAPPPRAGLVQPIAFVVPTGKAVSDAPIAPTKVTTPLVPPQITPQDEVRAESEVRIRFDEPMVPVAQVGVASPSPATITPAVPGTWRWIDTRVLTFTAAAPRLPQATQFTVAVQAGTHALSGATLATETKATFSTRPVAIAGGFPGSAIRPDSAIVVKLDQEI
ncbi:MAG: alpha-2-macroglobulin domain protein, partial [Deltaproteobacteria bacterium]|nr:alpha-2-macroglobulin domain protein [Deltaproteobacteria bacterium]